MGDFLSFLLFAVLFYVMMRFGCGAHMMRGHHGSRRSEAGSKHVDPVCGKDVEPNDGYGKMEAGRLYRFCSRECLDLFETEPGRYLRKRTEATS